MTRFHACIASLVAVFSLSGAAAKAMPSTDPVVNGSWSMTMALQPEPVMATLELVQKDAAVTGTLENEHLGTLRVSGKVADGSITFVAEGEAHGQAVRIEYAGKLQPNGSMSGDLTSPVGNTTWSATRVKK